MNAEEYKEQMKLLKEKHKQIEWELTKQFVDDNNPYKKGDVVTDHIGPVLVEQIGYYRNSWGEPSATYSGIELKKDGTPKKNNPKREVFQENLI
jgi:hypothetical protein